MMLPARIIADTYTAFLKFILLFICGRVYACIFLCGSMHMCDCLKRAETSDPMELESQAVLRHVIWGLGTELESSARVTYALNL